MGMMMDSYAFFTALADQSDGRGLAGEAKYTLYKYNLTAFILHDSNKSRKLHRHLEDSFFMLDHSTGRDLLFISLINQPKGREKPFWMGGRILNPRIAESNAPARVTAQAFASAFGIPADALPCIVVCNSPLDHDIEWFRTDADTINDQLNHLGLLARGNMRRPFTSNQETSINPLRKNGSVTLPVSVAESISNLLSLILAGQGRDEARHQADEVVNSLNRQMQNLKERLQPDSDDPEAANLFSDFCVKSGSIMALLNQPPRRTASRRQRPGTGPDKVCASEEEYDMSEPPCGAPPPSGIKYRTEEQALRSSMQRLSTDDPVSNKQDLSTLRISHELLEPESIAMLYTARTLIDAFSNPTLGIDMQQIDATPIVIMIANFFENEINYSVVQWMREQLGIEMPEYYYRHQSGKTALVEISSSFRINLNELREEKLLLPSMGHALPAYKHLTGLHPNPLPRDISPQRFIAEWDAVRIQRNAAAHPGIVHPEQVNVIVGPLHRLNREGTFGSLYELKERLRK